LADGGLLGPFSPIEYVVGAEGTPFGAIVHDPDASLNIQLLNGDVPAAVPPEYDGPAKGEVNATGKIVYGYNLRVKAAGKYRITYTMPNVSLSECNAATAYCVGNTTYLDITVAGGGGGGGKPVKPGK
jgi:hypothetical protein